MHPSFQFAAPAPENFCPRTRDLVEIAILCRLAHRGKTRDWIQPREEKGYFNNIIQELSLEDRFGFREMFKMDVTDFEDILARISDLICPKERLGGTKPILCDKRLSLCFRYRILQNSVSYIKSLL